MAEKQYWRSEVTGHGANFELRSSIALDLIEHFGSVAAKRGEHDDNTGRATIELQTPAELVDRCFCIADIFVDTASKRGEIGDPIGDVELARQSGEFDHAKSEAMFPKRSVDRGNVDNTPPLDVLKARADRARQLLDEALAKQAQEQPK
jgi:hypothetical protein